MTTTLARWLKLTWPGGNVPPLGKRGELYAARWLKRRGYRIVAGGRRTRYGEIDLVAVDGETIVFVEVKTRASGELSDAAAAVDIDKQRRIASTALAFLKEHGLLEYAARFDVVAIVWPDGARQPQLQHITSAFDPPGFGQFHG